MKKIISIILALAMCLTIFWGCTKDSPKPEDTIQKYENAFNNSDIEALLECYEPNVRKTYQGMLEIANLLTGADVGTLLNGLMGFGQIFMSESLPVVDMQINSKKQLSDKKVQLNITMTVTYGEESTSETDNIILILIENEWLISTEAPYVVENQVTSDITTTENTSNLEKIDPFENLRITYLGAAPYITATVDESLCAERVNKYVTFKMDENYLSNGDSFTVHAVFDEVQAKNNGLLFTETQKNYTVTGQPEYITNMDGIDATALHSELNDKLEAVTATNQGDGYFADIYIGRGGNAQRFYSVDSNTLTSIYMTSLKPQFKEKHKDNVYNRYMMIYTYVINGEKGSQSSIIVGVYANNIVKNPDSSLSWDFELKSISDSNYNDLINDNITSKKDYYNVVEIPKN